MSYPENFIMMPIPAEKFTDVCALLGGAAPAVSGNAYQPNRGERPETVAASQGLDKSSAGSVIGVAGNQASTGTGETATTAASPSDDSGEIDAHGHHWSADLHASTKGKTKEGLWRMKPGATRPDPLPGFPVEETDTATGTLSETPTPSATLPAATEEESAPADTSTQEDDEFAAFREASAKSDAADAAAVAAIPARTFSDADLGALCNQAAVKLGDPSPIKEIIAQFVPEGEIAHSRNVPEDKRADFVAAVEAKADIEFAG